MVTIADIAKETGLSIGSVSMILGKKQHRIPVATQKRVEAAAKRLGYYPNLQARSLRSKGTRNIGILIFDITDPYCSMILRGIDDSLYESGYMPVLTDLQNNPDRLRECAQTLMGRRVEGLIAIINPMYRESDILGEITRFEVPTVLIGRKLEGLKSEKNSFASVVVDNEAGTRAALEHLYRLGHRKIAFVKGPQAMSDSAPRWKGLVSFAKEAGLSIDPKLVQEIKGRNSSYEEGVRVTRTLLETGKNFTALVAFDDLTAFAAIGALTNAGRSIPADCSIVGFDDIPGAAYYNPPLTTIRQHLEIQGSMGAEMVKSLLVDPDGVKIESRHRVVAPMLIVRNSTAVNPLS
jgi:LacI family transcriptional regulator